jgi:hypothetical protein
MQAETTKPDSRTLRKTLSWNAHGILVECEVARRYCSFVYSALACFRIGIQWKLSEMLGVEHERVRLWIFARAAAEPRDDWNNFELLAVARAISS